MIDASVSRTIPLTPPSHFERRIGTTTYDTWIAPMGEANCIITHGFSDMFSSSSRQGSIENLSRIWLESPSSTASDRSLSDPLVDLLRATKREASVIEKDATKNLFEIRRLTGFTWEKLANLLNVDRRTLCNWVKGSEIRDSNRSRIAKTLRILRYSDRGSSDDNAKALNFTLTNGATAFEMIKAGRFPEARYAMGHGISRAGSFPQTNQMVSIGGWDLQPLTMHEDASGDDDLKQLPHEPKPASRKRRINRG